MQSWSTRRAWWASDRRGRAESWSASAWPGAERVVAGPAGPGLEIGADRPCDHGLAGGPAAVGTVPAAEPHSAVAEIGKVVMSRLAALMVLVGLMLTGCASGPTAPVGPPQRIELAYVGGSVQGGVSRVSVGLGRPVELIVRSDVADQLHVHGYDLKADVPAGGVGTVDFTADRSGVFEVELESRGTQLAQLEVR